MRALIIDIASSIKDIWFIYSTKKGIELSGNYAYCIWGEAEFNVENSCEEILLIPATVEKLWTKM